MTFAFEEISLEKERAYLDLLAKCPQVASDYSFLNIWGWANEYGLKWAWEENLVWIKQTVPEEQYWAPVGSWNAIDWQVRFLEFENGVRQFIRVPEKLAELWRPVLNDRAVIEEDRGNWDYIYSVNDLVDLKGNRFHKKKNLLNQFLKKYEFEYKSFDEDTIEHARMMQEDWCTWRDCESSEVLAAENRAIQRVFDHWNHFDSSLGGAIFVDQIIVAYTLAEPMTEDTLVIHFEKGCPDYKGVYQAINQMFLDATEGRYAFANREQDLGNEGLRKAKLSYHPTDFLKKYKISLK